MNLQTLSLWLVGLIGLLSVSISYATRNPESSISFLAGQHWLIGVVSFALS